VKQWTVNITLHMLASQASGFRVLLVPAKFDPPWVNAFVRPC